MYKLTNGLYIEKKDMGIFFLPDSNNYEAEAYKQWIAQGNIPESADAIPVPVKSDLDKTLELLLKNTNVAAEDQALKDELLSKLEQT